MILPGMITILTPIFVGLVFGAEPLGGYMAGVCVSGVMWAIFQNNAGGAWDNAKKSFEAGVEISGEMTYKGSDAHKAAVTGDTVGDPFKDTSGPSMNILIKLTCLVGLVIAPLLGGHDDSSSIALKASTENYEFKVNKDNTDSEYDFSVKVSAFNDENSKVKKAIEVNISGNENEVWDNVEKITPVIDEILDLN
tara:strand:- start:175 stop:756 length:582 start_codon:yes stop_codon:yes gene_type:complete